MVPHDLRQRLDDMLDALSRPEQAEGEQHLASFDAELRLVEAGVHKRHVRDAVWNDIHLCIRHTVGFTQNFRAFVRHHHHAVTAPHEFLHHLAL